MEHRAEYDLKVIGRNLRRLREQKGLSVEQIREYLRLGSVQAVYKYEAGVGYPQADTMLALMELYEVGVKEIVEEQGSSFFVDFVKSCQENAGKNVWGNGNIICTFYHFII